MSFQEDPALKGKSCEELMKCAEQRQVAAAQGCKRSAEVLQRLTDECTRADERVTDCLSKRTAEVVDLKTKLIKQQAEADSAILEMERFVAKIKRVNQPGEASGGNTEQLEQKQAERVKKAEDALEQIKAQRNQLTEDLRCKASALKIDDRCKIMTVTQSADLAPKLRRRSDTASVEKPGR